MNFKDVVEVLISIAGLIIAGFALNKANKTLFQPKRNEAIRKQTAITDAFFDYVNTNGGSIGNAVDYINIVRFNTEIFFRNHHVISEEAIEERNNEFKEQIGGWFILNPAPLNAQYAIGTIIEYDYFYYEKTKKLLQDTDIDIKVVLLTKKYVDFHFQLGQLSRNPFMPEEIRTVATKIGNAMLNNLTKLLPVILLKNFQKFKYEHLKQNLDDASTLKKDVFNDFSTRKVSHIDQFQELNECIRKYYLVDKKWV